MGVNEKATMVHDCPTATGLDQLRQGHLIALCALNINDISC